MPQGPVFGPVLFFALYLASWGRRNMGCHFCADDTQLYLSFNSLSVGDQARSVAQVVSCIRARYRPLATNKLKLNRDKTKWLAISCKFRSCLALDSVLVGDVHVRPSDTTRNIGVVFDKIGTLTQSVSPPCSISEI